MSIENLAFWEYTISFALIILLKIVCFILGYLTIKLGYRLINSGAKGQFKFSAKIGSIKGNLASVSPGLLFVLLGVILIGYAMYVEKGVEQNLSYTPTQKLGKLNLSIDDSSSIKNKIIEDSLTINKIKEVIRNEDR